MWTWIPFPIEDHQTHIKIKHDLERYGWTVVSTLYKGIIFGHTVGLRKNFDHPEIEVLGLTEEMMNLFLNHLGQQVKEGIRFEDGSVISDMVKDYDLILVTNPIHPGGPPITNGRLRLIWPDANHRYPWEPECQEACLTQLLSPDSTLLNREIYEAQALLGHAVYA